MRISARLAASAALAITLGCPASDGGVADVLVVATVEVTPGAVDVVVAGTQQLEATPKTSGGVAVPGRSVTWSSSDAAIASVSSSGLATGVAVGGPVRIRAMVDGIAGESQVTVQAVPVDHVVVTPGQSTVQVGGTQPLVAAALDAANQPLSGRSFLWQSSAPEIAAVTTTGLVLGVAPGGPVTISATAQGKTGTASVSVAARPATRLGFLQQPGSAVAGQPLTPAIKVALQDDLLNTVVSAGNPVTIALAGGAAGATLGGTTQGAPVNGIVTFANLTVDRAGAGYVLLVTSPGLVSATSNGFSVAAGQASQLGITTQPSAIVQSGQVFQQQPVIQLRDIAGNPVAQGGVSVTASIASGSGTLGGTATVATDASGVATFTNLAISGAGGSFTLGFASAGLTGVTSATILIGAGAPTALSITTQPTSSAQNGVPLSQQPSVQLRDGAGNPVSLAGVVISAAIASGTGTLGGTTSATTNSNGLAAFQSLAINGAAGTYTLRFTSPGLTSVVSASIVLGAGAPTQVAIVTQPSSSAPSGQVFAQQPAVQLRDGGGNPVSVSGVSVTVTASGGSLFGTVTITTNSTGGATFSGLGLTGTAGPYTLTFSSSGLTPATSATITLTAGTATQLGITTQPSAGAQSGTAFAQQPVVQLRDAAGNAVAQAGTVVTAVLATGPAGGTLGGTLTATTSAAGAATFTNLAITGPSGTYTIQFSATSLTAATSSGVTLGAGAPTKLVITIQPSASAQSGVAFGQQPALQLQDAASNPVNQSGIVVTAAIATGDGTLGGTVTATTLNGVATFTNLSISGVVGARTLSFSASGLTSATSGTITVSAGPASQLTITTQPSASAQNGAAFAQQPVLQLRDGAGNLVSQTGVNVTAAIATGGGTLGGTVTVATDGSGVASFTNLSITGTVGDRTLSFSATGLTPATSSVITVTAGPGVKLTITSQPSASVQSGVAFGQQPVIQIRDAGDNPVAQSGVLVTVSIQTGNPSLSGTTTIATDPNGAAAFTNLTITGLVGDRVLLFGAAGYVGVASSTVTVTPGVANHLTITTQPSSSVQSSVVFPQQPVIQLRDASENPVSQSGVNVTATIASGGGTLGGTATVATNASGVAAFTGLEISGSPGPRTLSFDAAGPPALTGVVSATINITPPPADHLTITTQPSTSAQSGVAFAAQPAVQLRDNTGTAVAQSGVVVTASIASGGGTLDGTVTAFTDVNGLATFLDLKISGTIGNRTLRFDATSLTGVVSGTINVTAGPASQLAITTQPSSSAQSGVALAQQPVLQLQDASGNAVSTSGVTVTAAMGSGSGTLSGTTGVSTVSGVATFTDLSISGLAGQEALSFSGTSLGSVASNPITLTAGPPSQLMITTQPSSSAQDGVAFAQQPVLQIADAAGNPVSQAGVDVKASASAPGILTGTTTIQTNANGAATYAGLALTGAPGDYTLGFTANSLTSATSATIALAAAAGPPAMLAVFTQPPSSAANGAALSPAPVVQLQDAGGNPVSTSGVSITMTIASGSGSLAGTTTVDTDGTGRATFTGVSIIGAVGSYTLAFNSTGLTGATSNTISLGPGAATQLTITQQPSGTATSGTPFAQQPKIQLRDSGGNAVSQAGVTVSAALTSAGGPLAGGASVTTDGSGVATFINLKVQSSGTYTLRFTSGSLSAVVSMAIVVT